MSAADQKPISFVHLHVHSHYSLLNALPQIQELVDESKKLGMPALALTDNGNLYGAIEFYKACKKAGIKPIIGVDAMSPSARATTCRPAWTIAAPGWSCGEKPDRLSQSDPACHRLVSRGLLLQAAH